MKSGLTRQFLWNYLIAFLLSILAAFFAVLLLSFASDVLSKGLMKNQFPADALMRDDYAQIEAAQVVENGGGVTVVDGDYKVVRSEGIDPFKGRALSAASFTDFLVTSHAVGTPFHYDVAYNEKGGFWLIVTFPTSIRLDIAVAFNREAMSKDIGNVSASLVAAGIFYLLLLAAFAAAFSRITSRRIITPLQKLMEGTKRLRAGDYSARVDLKFKNEFAELQKTFNDMAERIERETALREQSEAERKRLILDVSHDLKNPLASVTGYSELCLKRAEELGEPVKGYLEVIQKNSRRASALLTELFELSRLESPDFRLKPERLDACEILRQACGDILPSLEQAGFGYEFDIPDEPAYALIDAGRAEPRAPQPRGQRRALQPGGNVRHRAAYENGPARAHHLPGRRRRHPGIRRPRHLQALRPDGRRPRLGDGRRGAGALHRAKDRPGPRRDADAGPKRPPRLRVYPGTPAGLRRI